MPMVAHWRPVILPPVAVVNALSYAIPDHSTLGQWVGASRAPFRRPLVPPIARGPCPVRDGKYYPVRGT